MSTILARPPPRDAAAIFELTAEEIANNFTQPLRTADELSKKFDEGRWRPIYRFLVRQADGKTRLIDDGRRGGQNDWSALEDKIFTRGIDTVPSIVKLLVDRVRAQHPGQELPDWLQLQLGTDDLPDAFRGCPIHPDQRRAAVVAVWSPAGHGWRCGVMNGCPPPHGMGSVVVTFNRYPPSPQRCFAEHSA